MTRDRHENIAADLTTDARTEQDDTAAPEQHSHLGRQYYYTASKEQLP